MIGVKAAFLATMLMGASGATLATPEPNLTAADDLSGIRTAVEQYFDGTENGKPALLRDTFASSLEIQFVAPDGTLGRITADEYIGRIIEGKKANRKGHIVSIDVTGNAAVAKAEIDMGKRVYTDYLLLLRLEQGWRVTNKIATYRTKETVE